MSKVIDLKERVKTMMSEEGIGTKDIEKALQEIKAESIPFSDLPKAEQIDYFVNRISASDFEVEIADMLTTLTAYSGNAFEIIIEKENGEYMDYVEHTDDTLKNLLMSNILDAEDPYEEEKCWNLMIDTLGTDKIFQCFDDDYRKEFTAGTCKIEEKIAMMLHELSMRYL